MLMTMVAAFETNTGVHVVAWLVAAVTWVCGGTALWVELCCGIVYIRSQTGECGHVQIQHSSVLEINTSLFSSLVRLHLPFNPMMAHPKYLVCTIRTASTAPPPSRDGNAAAGIDMLQHHTSWRCWQCCESGRCAAQT